MSSLRALAMLWYAGLEIFLPGRPPWEMMKLRTTSAAVPSSGVGVELFAAVTANSIKVLRSLVAQHEMMVGAPSLLK